jgi:hypothetical protein
MDEARVGFEVDDARGTRVGTVHGHFVDADSGAVAWLVVALGRRRQKLVAIPAAECAAAGGRVWVAQERVRLRTAPVVDPGRPLLREHELTICGHYGIGESVGRAAEVAGREAEAVTSRPR